MKINLSEAIIGLFVLSLTIASASCSDNGTTSNPNADGGSSKRIAIITAGQSNSDGRNPFDEFPSEFQPRNPSVHIFKDGTGRYSDFQITHKEDGKDWSYDAIVYNLLTSKEYGGQDEIYVMKRTKGGTSIDPKGESDYHWTVEYDKLPEISKSLLLNFESIIKAAMAAKGSEFEIKAFIWHQGEGDSNEQEVAERYYDNLKKMLAYVREVVGNPELQFICGNISESNITNKYKDIVNDAFDKLSSEDPFFHVIDLRHAQLFDNWHFNSKWSEYFGQKVYDKMVDLGIVNGKKVNPAEP